jgi:hypothetical protein
MNANSCSAKRNPGFGEPWEDARARHYDRLRQGE